MSFCSSRSSSSVRRPRRGVHDRPRSAPLRIHVAGRSRGRRLAHRQWRRLVSRLGRRRCRHGGDREPLFGRGRCGARRCSLRRRTVAWKEALEGRTGAWARTGALARALVGTKDDGVNLWSGLGLAPLLRTRCLDPELNPTEERIRRRPSSSWPLRPRSSRGRAAWRSPLRVQTGHRCDANVAPGED